VGLRALLLEGILQTNQINVKMENNLAEREIVNRVAIAV
jgi:hypothetical protein